MAGNQIWWIIAKATDEELSDSVGDIQCNTAVIPFVGELGGEDDGAFTNEEFVVWLREFASV